MATVFTLLKSSVSCRPRALSEMAVMNQQTVCSKSPVVEQNFSKPVILQETSRLQDNSSRFDVAQTLSRSGNDVKLL